MLDGLDLKGRCALNWSRTRSTQLLRTAAVSRPRSAPATTGRSTALRAYAGLCRKLGVTQSMGIVGSSANNTLAESINATPKREIV